MGIAYDIISIVRLIFKRKSVSFLLDALFMISYGLLIMVVTYAKNFGSYRWYAFCGSFISLYLYRISIGKAVIKIETFVINLVINIIQHIFRKVRKVLDFFLKFVKINLKKLYSKRFVKKLLSEAKSHTAERSSMKKDVLKTEKQKLNFWVKLAMIFISVFFLVAIIKMNMQINDMKAELNKSIVEVEKRQLSIEKIQSEIDSFPKDIENLDEEAIKKIAREKLNLQDSDVIIFANSQPN